jgi:hypothetical protein
MNEAPIDPIDLPGWAVQPMLDLGFSLEEMRATPFPVTETERQQCQVIDFRERRRRALLSEANKLARAVRGSGA